MASAHSSPSPGDQPRELRYQEALREALRLEMARDPRVFVMGEDVALFGGAYGVTRGLAKEFGTERVRDTPISEAAQVGLAIGAAINGLRPVLELQFCDLLPLCWDQLVTHAARTYYQTGGRISVPMVVRTKFGTRPGGGPSHSNCNHGAFFNFPGLKVVLPTIPADAKGLLLSAIRDPNPVLCFESHHLYGTTGPVPEGDYTVPIGKAALRRQGTDLTLITCGGILLRVQEAAKRLEEKGISVEILDLRTLIPLDEETLLASVARTGRALVIDEGFTRGGVTAEVAALIQENLFSRLKGPVVRMGTHPIPPPHSPPLVEAIVPSVEGIVGAAVKMVSANKS